MTKAVIAIYNFLKERRWLMYLLLIASTVVFAFFGMKVQYEENIAKLLPPSENSGAGATAFENIKVKDKIFIQVVRKDGKADAGYLSELCTEFTDSLMAKDKGYIGNILSVIDADVMTNGLDYLLTHLPSFVDTTCYRTFDKLLAEETLSAQMASNSRIISNDMTGSATTMVSSDPAALRNAVLSGLGNATGGYTIVDGQLFCPDTTAALAFLSPDFNSLDSKAGNNLVKLIENESESFEQRHPEAEILFHGSPVQSVFNARRIKTDLVMTVGISLLIICLFLGFCFRNKSSVFQLLGPVAYGTLFSLACIWWIKGGMSVMALGIGAIVLGVALSYSLHIVTHYKYVNDPVKVLQDETMPVILGVLTTVGAFVGLLFTDSELLKDFGMFASFAMIGTLFFILIFLPHFFNPQTNKRSETAFRILDKINSFPLDKVKWLKWSLVGICIIGCVFSGKVKFDSDLKNIGWNEPKVVRAKELYDQKNNVGLASMYYAASADNYESALKASKKVNAVMDSLKKAGVINQYSDISPILVGKDVQQERIAKWTSYWNKKQVRKVERLIKSEARKNDLDPDMFMPFFAMIESEYEPCNIYSDEVLPEGLLCNFVEKTSDKWLVFTAAKMPAENKVKVNTAVDSVKGAVIIDPFWYTKDMAESLNDDFNTVVLISSIFVLIVLLISFKSISIALTAFMPMALSWLTVNGLMAIFGLEFNLINIVIATFIFGIGVDYSIFVTNGLIDQAKGLGNSLLTCHKTAIFLSAVVLIVVTGSLIFASHPAINSIGVSTLIGMTTTLLITYTLQPAMFRWLMNFKFFRKRNGYER